MIAFTAVLLTTAAILYTLAVRKQSVPRPEPVAPGAHLEERKAAIYENLRDLQFEYRVGKLSEHDYQQTKLDLQRELASVLAGLEKITGGAPVVVEAAEPQAETARVCPKCGAKFAREMKFCGECGSPMAGGAA